jgi:long-chain acyl-CoA synthetase
MSDAVKTPLEMFYHWERNAPERIYLRQSVGGQWVEHSWSQVGSRVRRIAAFIASRNLPADSKIAIWAGNSADWFMVDFAIMLAGHISVPLFAGQDSKAARYILEHVECPLIFLGAFDQSDKANQAIPPNVTRVAMPGCQVPCQVTLEDAVRAHEPMIESPIPDPDATFTIIYTSGSTGAPKGVMHAHATPGNVIPGINKALRQENQPRFFSYLPLAHIAERVLVEMCSLYGDGSVSFSEGLASFAGELRDVQPTTFFSVPRLWTKFKESVEAKIAPATLAQLNDGQKAAIRQQLGLGAGGIYVTGSAPCRKDVHQWFLDLGVVLRDAYGTTEHFANGAIWYHDDHPIPGCIGRPVSNGEFRISPQGEVLFKGPGIMQGYYREPEKTAQTVIDGWYHIGDSGRLDENGNLYVTGRMSDVFKTTKGKFVDPLPLEGELAKLTALGQICVFGQGLDHPVLVANLSEQGRALNQAEIEKQVGQALDRLNASVPAHSVVKQALVVREDWLVGNGLMTPTLKIRRKQVEEFYRDRLVSLPAGTIVNFD